MAQKFKELLQWFHWGIGNHDIYLGDNQVAYAENVHLLNPEFVSLAQKSENYALTDDDLVLSKLELEYNWHAYLGTTSGKMYDKGNNIVLCTTAYAQAITSIFYRYTYLYWCMWSSRVGRIDPAYMIDWSSWVSWDLEAQATYTESHKTSTSDFPIKSREVDGSEVMCLCNGALKSADNTLTYTTLNTLIWVPVGMRVTLNYWKMLNHRGYLTYADGTSPNTAAGKDYSSFYIEWIYINDLEIIISWITQENSFLFVPNWEAKQSIAVARRSWPDEQYVHYYGRRTNPLESLDSRYRQFWNDTHWSYNDMWFMINRNGVMCYGSYLPWLPRSRFMFTKNYNGDYIDEVWMVKVESVSATGENWLYYSWRVWETFWVDRIAVDYIWTPDLYCLNWIFYTKKYDYQDNKAYIGKVKIKAYTTATQTIKLYSSVDWWGWVLEETLNWTDPKKYFLCNINKECYTIQWKIELDTDDEDLTPKFYAMSFTGTIWDNE